MDGDPHNDRLENLKTLCRSCHQAVERAAHAPTGTRLVVMCGAPGSGKTTYAQRLQAHGKGAHVAVDTCRALVSGSTGPRDQTVTSQAFNLAYSKTRQLLRGGTHVLFDSTAVSTQARASLLKLAADNNADPHLIVLEAPLPDLLARNDTRPKADHVPQPRLVSMYRSLEASRSSLDREGFTTVTYPEGVGGTPHSTPRDTAPPIAKTMRIAGHRDSGGR